MSQISQKILKYKTIVELDRPTQVRGLPIKVLHILSLEKKFFKGGKKAA